MKTCVKVKKNVMIIGSDSKHPKYRNYLGASKMEAVWVETVVYVPVNS